MVNAGKYLPYIDVMGYGPLPLFLIDAALVFQGDIYRFQRLIFWNMIKTNYYPENVFNPNTGGFEGDVPFQFRFQPLNNVFILFQGCQDWRVYLGSTPPRMQSWQLKV